MCLSSHSFSPKGTIWGRPARHSKERVDRPRFSNRTIRAKTGKLSLGSVNIETVVRILQTHHAVLVMDAGVVTGVITKHDLISLIVERA